MSTGLAHTCPEDGLLARLLDGQCTEVEREALVGHLDGCAACQSLLGAAMRAESGADEMQPGDTVGRYRIVGRLGAGAMGVVYAARDPLLERDVALKIVRTTTSPDLVLREARAMARLRHPNVIRVYDVGVAGDVLFIAMEKVAAGRTLRVWLDGRARRWRELRTVLLAAGRGLEAAHRVGIVHRDFKPDNVLVDEDQRVFVTDFGLARPAAGGVVVSGGVSASTRGIAGTPAYMAPEQLAGGAATDRADQFAYCVAIHEALTGRRPFAGDTIAELRCALSGPLSRPAGIPRTVWLALARGLSPDPDRRFPSMGALLAALEGRPRRHALAIAAVAVLSVGAASGALIRGEDAPPCASIGEDVSATWRWPRQIMVIGALHAAGWSPVAIGGWRQQVATRLTDNAAARREACLDTRARGRQSAAALDARLSCLDAELAGLDAVTSAAEAGTLTPGAALRALAALPAATDCSLARARGRSHLAPPPALAARFAPVRERIARGAALRLAGDLDGSDEALAVARDEAHPLGYPPLAALATLEAARTAGARSELARARALALEAADLAARARDDVREAEAWIYLVYLAGYLADDRDAANAWISASRAAIARAGDPLALRAALARHRGGLEIARGRPLAAVAHFREAVGLEREAHEPDRQAVASARVNLGIALRKAGRAADALVEFDAAIALLGAEPAASAAALLVARAERGVTRWLLGAEEADAELEAVLADQRALLGEDDEATVQTLDHLGRTAQARGDHAVAEARWRAVLEARESRLGPDHRRVADALANLGVALAAAGRVPEALVAYERVGAIRARALAPDHPDLAETLNNIGTLHRATGATEQARTAFARAHAIARAAHGEAHPMVASIAVNLADLALERGEVAAARDGYRSALPALENRPAHSAHLAYALRGLALAEIAEGSWRLAVGHAERAVVLARDGGAPARSSASARYALAQALWGLGERQRARREGRAAARGFQSAGDPEAAAVVSRWLAATR